MAQQVGSLSRTLCLHYEDGSSGFYCVCPKLQFHTTTHLSSEIFVHLIFKKCSQLHDIWTTVVLVNPIGVLGQQFGRTGDKSCFATSLGETDCFLILQENVRLNFGNLFISSGLVETNEDLCMQNIHIQSLCVLPDS